MVEVMISASIGAMVMVGVMSTYLWLVRSGLAAMNYSEMDTQARRSFEALANDVKMTTAFLTASTYTVANDSNSPYTKAVTLTIPNTPTSTGYTITYGWDQTSKWFYSVPGSTVPADGTASVAGRIILARNVTNLYFNTYQQSSSGVISLAATDAVAKHLQCFMTLQRTAVGATTVSETIRSAAFTMRNKP